MPDASALARQEYRILQLEDVLRHPQNSRRGDVEAIVESIRANGFYGAVGIQRSTGFLIYGNHRTDAALLARRRIEEARSGAWEAHDEAEAALIESWRSWPERFGGELDGLPAIDLDVDDETALRILIADNKTSDDAGWDRPGLIALLDDLVERRGTLEGTGFSRPELDLLRREEDLGVDARGAFARGDPQRLADRFLVPPFSVLDARQGYWQERKRSWLVLGIRGEDGRPRNTLKMSPAALEAGNWNRPMHTTLNPERNVQSMPGTRPQPNRSTPTGDSGNDPQFYWKKQEAEERVGHPLSTAEFLAEHYDGTDSYVGGTSAFDPVLCELAYRWWTPAGARILDPFAGGSVRGIVASRLGRSYVGIDLSAEQIAANEEQADLICREDDPRPRWLVGDAREQAALLDGEEPFDFILSCPPYFDLERYSDDPADLSNAESWEAFSEAYEECIAQACSRLRPGRFACFVVGNVREIESGEGALHDLQAATVQAFVRAGLLFYNDAVLVVAVGSLAMRAARIFRTRKLGRTHQAVLVFLKPPLSDALEACGEVEIADPAEMFGEPLS